MVAAHLSEVFSSIEGEGMNAGRRAAFLRFAGCNLSCSFCDTQYARQRCETMAVYMNGGKRDLSNPIPCDEIISLIDTGFGESATVVLTGGEPLLQLPALCCLSRRLRMRGYRIHLETNGTLPEAFNEIRDLVDFVCMDIKLPSAQGGRRFEREHLGFLAALRGRKAAAKIVVTEEVTAEEFADAVGMVAGINPYLPLLLQPAYCGSKPGIGTKRLLRFQAMALGELHDVRISLQFHKHLSIR